MAATERKSLIPVKETVVVPYNNGATYNTGSVIQILFGAGDVSNWLVQDSFFQFDLNLTITGNAATAAIKSAHQIFDWVEVQYQGKQIYIQNFNQQAKFIDYVQNGGDYLDSEINTYATSKNLRYCHLYLDSGANTKRGCIIRVGELFNIFSQVLEIPMKKLKNQLQLNFHIADPKTFVSYPVPVTSRGDELYNFSKPPAGVVFSNFSIDRFEFHIKDRISSSPGVSADSTIKFDYVMPQISLRGISATDFPINSTISLPFSIVTENVDGMGIYFYYNDHPVNAFRPELINVNFKYGNNTSPFSPVNVDSYTNPGIYKTLINDYFDIGMGIFNTTNRDYDASYDRRLPGSENIINIEPENVTALYKEDCHIVLASDFVTSADVLGSPSRAWNSQYIFQATAVGRAIPACTACMWVKSRYMAIIHDGIIETVNV